MLTYIVLLVIPLDCVFTESVIDYEPARSEMRTHAELELEPAESSDWDQQFESIGNDLDQNNRSLKAIQGKLSSFKGLIENTNENANSETERRVFRKGSSEISDDETEIESKQYGNLYPAGNSRKMHDKYGFQLEEQSNQTFDPNLFEARSEYGWRHLQHTSTQPANGSGTSPDGSDIEQMPENESEESRSEQTPKSEILFKSADFKHKFGLEKEKQTDSRVKKQWLRFPVAAVGLGKKNKRPRTSAVSGRENDVFNFYSSKTSGTFNWAKIFRRSRS